MLQPTLLRFGISACAVFVALTLYLLAQPPAARTASPNVVISQIYGAGGNSGASWRNDFIELFNRGSAPVSLNGWSIQYAASTGTTWQKTDLAGTLQPGQYFLIQQSSGGANGALLPTPNATGAISMAATAGKVALLNATTLVSSGTSCPSGANVVDLVGYGSGTNCFEGSGPTTAPSATNAVFRASNGCTDNDNNTGDFAAAAANPRNTASPMNVCGAPTNPIGTGAASPSTVAAGNTTLLTVTVTPGVNPTSTGITVTSDLTAIGGSATQQFFDNGTNGDATAGDNIFSFLATVASNTTAGMKSLPITIADAQSRGSNTAISLTVVVAPPPGNVGISQIFGGGGNSGAPFQNDFVEIFNRGMTTVNLSGFSVQYASAASASWQVTPLTGSLAPGQYYLIQEGSGGVNGSLLPTPNAIDTIAMSSTAGKVALVNSTSALSGACPFGASVIDFVGYGSTANCFEGPGPTAAPSSSTAVLRGGQGCTDTTNNTADFATGTPNPRNTAFPTNICGAPTSPAGMGAANPTTVTAGSATLLTVAVTPGTNPPSTGISVIVDLTSIGGAATQQFFDNGTNGDVTVGDNIFSFQATVAPSTTPGAKNLAVSIADAQARTGSTTIALTVQAPPAAGSVVISQVFGGGGNSGAPFANDFIELFNRSNQPVNISGWSIQYSSATGTSWQKTDLTGTLQPGQYFLIQEDSGGSSGVPLPTPNATGTIALASTAGKVALSSNGTLIANGTSCPSGGLVDFVGYGGSATCFEGTGPAPSPSSTNAIFRRGDGCADTDNNNLNFDVGSPNPHNTGAPFNNCSSVAFFDVNSVTLTIQELPTCIGAGDLLFVEATLTNIGTRNQTDNFGSEFTAKLSPTLVAVPDSCVSTGTCVITNARQLDWNGAIPVGQTITIRFQVQVADIPGTPLCVNSTVNYDSDNDGLNNATITLDQCRSVSCPPIGPGLALPNSSEVSDQKAGSVLVYPFYSSDPISFKRENTRISLTNIHPQRRVTVHFFFIEDDSNSVADAFLCLTPNQTASFLLSDLDPGVSGFLIAIASDEGLGCPINFNFLIGDEYVKLASGHMANLAAEAFAAIAGAPVPCDESSTTAELKFDGVQYNAAPRTLAVDHLASPADGNTPLLILDRFDGNLASGLSTIGQLTGLLYDDMENAFSFEFSSARRQFRSIIANAFPRTAPRVPNIIPAGHSGWLKLARSGDGAMLGAIINFNPNATSQASAFNQGHNLHKLTLTTDATLIVPVFPPNC
jgi:predicted extracellular nuclease